MKKILFIILLAVIFSKGVYAAGVEKNALSKRGSFQSEFLQSTNIRSLDMIENEVSQARQKSDENKLPIQAKRSFSKMFDGFRIKQVTHFTGTDGEAFYINAENEKESIIVKIDDNLEISIIKKEKDCRLDK